MRLTKTIAAGLLASSASAPTFACELDGPGGHRFFAFANMYKGGQPQGAPEDQSRPEAPAERPSESEEQNRRSGGPDGSDDDAGADDPGTSG